MYFKPVKMIFKLKKLILLFIFLLIFYAIYLLILNRTFLKLISDLNYEPVNYRNLGQMHRLKMKYELLNKIKNEKIVLNKLKSTNKLYKELDCLINDEFNVNCFKSIVNQEIYLPFNSFIKNYFDVYGRLEINKLDKDKEIFHFDHSYSKIYPPTDKYDFKSKFLWFENYNVDNRDRVKFISGLYNVPISNQWKTKNENGHFYPIQIAQFGLSHFNKYLSFGLSKFIYLNVDKYMRNNLKFNESELKDNNNNLIKLDEFNTTTELIYQNKSILEPIPKPIETRNLKKRRIIQIKDKLNKPETDQSNEQSSEEEDDNEVDEKTKLINLNNTNLIIQLNLTQKSPFFNSLFLSFKYKLIKNLKITIILINDKKTKFKVNYKSINNDLFKNDQLIYGIGNSTEDKWRLFTRNLGVDLIKSINLSKRKNLVNLKLKSLHLFSIQLNGNAIIDEIKLSTNGHFFHFVNSVNWLIRFQDEIGGWESKVNKRLVSSSLILNNNWYSSMAQGHAISLLVRMFHFVNQFNLIEFDSLINNETNTTTKTTNQLNDNLIKDELVNLRNNLNDSSLYVDDDNLILNNSLHYLNSAIQATNLFKKNISENGIATYFMDKYVWYEEYPTEPSSFVLNGFIYSLFGLYDVKMTIDLLIKSQKLDQQLNNYYLTKFNEIDELYSNGIKSLKIILPLFDSGYSSYYDLRHFTLNVAPIIARWDYHTTHINQLLYLNTIAILKDKNIDNLIIRWRGYLRGKRSQHN